MNPMKSKNLVRKTRNNFKMGRKSKRRNYKGKKGAKKICFEENYEFGDLVWAKMVTYPYWPGMVMKPKKPPYEKEHQYQVYFYGTKNHAWVPTVQIIRNSEYAHWKYEKLKVKRKGLKEAVQEMIDAAEDPSTIYGPSWDAGPSTSTVTTVDRDKHSTIKQRLRGKDVALKCYWDPKAKMSFPIENFTRQWQSRQCWVVLLGNCGVITDGVGCINLLLNEDEVPHSSESKDDPASDPKKNVSNASSSDLEAGNNAEADMEGSPDNADGNVEESPDSSADESCPVLLTVKNVNLASAIDTLYAEDEHSTVSADENRKEELDVDNGSLALIEAKDIIPSADEKEKSNTFSVRKNSTPEISDVVKEKDRGSSALLSSDTMGKLDPLIDKRECDKDNPAVWKEVSKVYSAENMESGEENSAEKKEGTTELSDEDEIEFIYNSKTDNLNWKIEHGEASLNRKEFSPNTSSKRQFFSNLESKGNLSPAEEGSSKNIVKKIVDSKASKGQKIDSEISSTRKHVSESYGKAPSHEKEESSCIVPSARKKNGNEVCLAVKDNKASCVSKLKSTKTSPERDYSKAPPAKKPKLCHAFSKEVCQEKQKDKIGEKVIENDSKTDSFGRNDVSATTNTKNSAWDGNYLIPPEKIKIEKDDEVIPPTGRMEVSQVHCFTTYEVKKELLTEYYEMIAASTPPTDSLQVNESRFLGEYIKVYIPN